MLFFRKVFSVILLLILSLLAEAGHCEVAEPSIVINLPSRTLELYSGSEFIKEYPIAVGKPATPTPLGGFSIINKQVNPVWIPPRSGNVVESGPDNPLGYRWMGFLPLYGIHGTNAPWTIGMAVSNGCIRMYEEDAEELFDIVHYGTPVKITYDRIKVRIDQQGKVLLGIYPDLYGYGTIGLADVNNKLSKYGLRGILDDEFISKLIEKEVDKQFVIAQIRKIKVNGKKLSANVIVLEDKVLVPVWPVAAELNTDIHWDEKQGMISNRQTSVPGVVKGDIIYVSADDLKKLFGGQQEWNTTENCLEIDSLTVYLNNKILPIDVQVVDGILALPAIPLAQALNQKAEWDNNNKRFMSQNRNIEITVINNQPYICITKIYDYFKAYVYWDRRTRSIQLTFPFVAET